MDLSDWLEPFYLSQAFWLTGQSVDWQSLSQMPLPSLIGYDGVVGILWYSVVIHSSEQGWDEEAASYKKGCGQALPITDLPA